MFLIIGSDPIALAAKQVLIDANIIDPNADTGSVPDPSETIAIFTTPCGTFKGTYIRHGTIESLASREIHIPPEAVLAKYGIALKRFDSPDTGHPRFRQAILSVNCVRAFVPKVTRPVRPASEWRSGLRARKREGRLLSRFELYDL